MHWSIRSQSRTRYEGIVQELEHKHAKESIETARRVLLWVSFAEKPLTLKELWDATTIPLDQEVRDFKSLVKSRVRWHSASQFWLGILEICEPLIENVHVDLFATDRVTSGLQKISEADTVQLIHQTVKEFLVHPEAGAFRVCPEDPSKLPSVCWRYLSLSLPVPGFHNLLLFRWTLEDNKAFGRAIEERPLLGHCIMVAPQAE